MICVGLSFAFVDSFSYWQRCFDGICSYLVLRTSQSHLVCFAGAWHNMTLIWEVQLIEILHSEVFGCCANSSRYLEVHERLNLWNEVGDLLDLELLSFGKVSFFESWRQRLAQEEVLACQEQRQLWEPDLLSRSPTSVPFADHSHSPNFEGKFE